MKPNVKESSLEPFREYIIDQLKLHKIRKEIHSEIVRQGFSGKLTGFYDFCKNLIKEQKLEGYDKQNTLGVPLSYRIEPRISIKRSQVIDFIWSRRNIPDQDREMLLSQYPILYELKSCVHEFSDAFRSKSVVKLHLFIERYSKSNIKEIRTFSRNLLSDIDSIEHAVASDYSNGFVEGSNNRLKMIKRTMYGRAGLPLLRAKILG